MTAPLSVVIAEDEPLVRDYVRDLVEARGDFSVAAACANGVEAVAAVRRYHPDLLLLDIEMPGMTGLDVLDALGDEAPPAIFVTAYDGYSLRAFDLHAVDYVLKPIDEERFDQALGRAVERVRQGEVHRLSRRLLGLLRTLGVDDLGMEPEAMGVPAFTPTADPTDAPLERLSVRVRDRWLLLDVRDIDWIKGAGVYAEVHVGEHRHLLRETLRTLEERLPSPPFVRVHRSAIVNAEAVCEVRPLSHGDYLLQLKDGTPLRASRSYRHGIAALLRGAAPPLREPR